MALFSACLVLEVAASAAAPVSVGGMDQDTRPKGASLVANTFIPDPGVMRTAFPRDAHTRARQSDRRTGIVFACIGDRTSYRT
jgi:hypothetical protein